MAGELRLAELIAALSLATDLGMGQPLEQGLRTTLIALEIGDRAGLSSDDLAQVFYVSLLRFVGCTADAHEAALMVGGDEIALRAAIAPVLGGDPREFMSRVMPSVGAGQPPLKRAALVAGMMTSGRERSRAGVHAHCELAENLAQRIGLESDVRRGLACALEQWNGSGMPNGVRGEHIPVSARIVFLSRDIEVLHRLFGPEAVASAVKGRSGRAYDPELANLFLKADQSHVTAVFSMTSPWDEVMRREPEPKPWVSENRLTAVLAAFADFIDLKSPFTAGHSREVASLASATAPENRDLRRAALLHDLGRVSVPNGIWDKPGPLTEAEWERVRLHPYYTERIIGRVTALEGLARLAGMHHERLDGTGYHRGSSRSEIPEDARLLAATDAYQAMTQPRPHRAALSPDRAADAVQAMAKSGGLDTAAVDRVLSVAGHQRPGTQRDLPADLTEREVEVLRRICRGETKKQVAASLSISPSTVDHHVRHIYEKAGVKTRAGATLFALENELLQ